MQRPPAFMFRYVGSLYGLKKWEDIEQVDTYMTQQAPDLLGLPEPDGAICAPTTSAFFPPRPGVCRCQGPVGLGELHLCQ